MSLGEQMTVCTTGEPTEGPRPSALGKSSTPIWDKTPGPTRPSLDSTDLPPFGFPIKAPLETKYPEIRPESVYNSVRSEEVDSDDQVVISFLTARGSGKLKRMLFPNVLLLDSKARPSFIML